MKEPVQFYNHDSQVFETTAHNADYWFLNMKTVAFGRFFEITETPAIL
jgi:hypothetical protein